MTANQPCLPGCQPPYHSMMCDNEGYPPSEPNAKAEPAPAPEPAQCLSDCRWIEPPPNTVVWHHADGCPKQQAALAPYVAKMAEAVEACFDGLSPEERKRRLEAFCLGAEKLNAKPPEEEKAQDAEAGLEIWPKGQGSAQTQERENREAAPKSLIAEPAQESGASEPIDFEAADKWAKWIQEEFPNMKEETLLADAYFAARAESAGHQKNFRNLREIFKAVQAERDEARGELAQLRESSERTIAEMKAKLAKVTEERDGLMKFIDRTEEQRRAEKEGE